MTFWAKLLTVIVLVLSIAFAAMSGVVFAKRENLRGQLQQEQATRARNERRASETIADLESKLEGRTSELEIAMTKLDAQERDLQGLRAEVAEHRAQAEDHKARMEALTDAHSQVVASLDATVARNLALSQDNDKIVSENRTLIANLADERQRANNLETLNAALTTERDELKVALASARETIEIHEEAFAELSRNNITVRPTIESIIAVPQIRGKVASVDDETNIVILNVGVKDGVRKNFPFTVWRGDRFVAKISVFEIYDDYCVAQVVDPKLEIKLGDNAWTRLY